MTNRVFTINTQEGRVSFLTPELRGYIERVIITSDETLQVRMSIDDTANFVIYDGTIKGSASLPLRLTPMNDEGALIAYQGDKILLEGKVNIMVSGRPNTALKVKFLLS